MNITMMGYTEQVAGRVIINDYVSGAVLVDWTEAGDLANFSEPSPGVYTLNVGSLTGLWRVRVFDTTDSLIFTGFAGADYPDLSDTLPWVQAAVTLVLPASMQGQSRHFANTMEFKLGETGEVSFPLFDASGNALDLDGMTLELRFSGPDRVDIVTLSSGDLSVSGNTVTFSIPTLVTTDEIEEGFFSFRNSANGDLEVAGGLFNTRYSP